MNQTPLPTPTVRRSQRLLERRLREENSGLRLLARVASAFGDPEEIPMTPELPVTQGGRLEEPVAEDYDNAHRHDSTIEQNSENPSPPAATVSFDSPLAELIIEDVGQAPVGDDSAMETDSSSARTSIGLPVPLTHTGLRAANDLHFTYFDGAQRISDSEVWTLSQHTPVCQVTVGSSIQLVAARIEPFSSCSFISPATVALLGLDPSSRMSAPEELTTFVPGFGTVRILGTLYIPIQILHRSSVVGFELVDAFPLVFGSDIISIFDFILAPTKRKVYMGDMLTAIADTAVRRRLTATFR